MHDATPAESSASPPRHIAIIMDGNGRWAKQRGQPRTRGHRAGADSVLEAAETCGELGVDFLTLYAFSSENWSRPRREVEALMKLLQQFLKERTPEMLEKNVKLRAIGRLHLLPEKCQQQLQDSIDATSQNTGLTLILALSYGAREEIIDAVSSLAQKAAAGEIDAASIDRDLFAQHLYTGEYPDPDLLIRTSGEMRISNFLLWQISYAEIYVTETLWPDFRRPHLVAALEDFSKRQRRFGAV